MFEQAEVISSYSRAQGIEDGVLVDVSEVAKEAGITFPVAMTRTVWCECVEVPKGFEGIQDEMGRLWDVLWMFKVAAQRIEGDRLEYQLMLLEGTKNGKCRHRKVTLKAVCGPGDDLEPVITIMQPDED